MSRITGADCGEYSHQLTAFLGGEAGSFWLFRGGPGQLDAIITCIGDAQLKEQWVGRATTAHPQKASYTTKTPAKVRVLRVGRLGGGIGIRDKGEQWRGGWGSGGK